MQGGCALNCARSKRYFPIERSGWAKRRKLFCATSKKTGRMGWSASVEGPGTPCPTDLLRLSVGVEDVRDLIDDLKSALEEI
jgi:hypothetical protein